MEDNLPNDKNMSYNQVKRRRAKKNKSLAKQNPSYIKCTFCSFFSNQTDMIVHKKAVHDSTASGNFYPIDDLFDYTKKMCMPIPKYFLNGQIKGMWHYTVTVGSVKTTASGKSKNDAKRSVASWMLHKLLKKKHKKLISHIFRHCSD